MRIYTRSCQFAFFAALLLLLVCGPLYAQCDRVGWVASSSPTCGVKIIDLDSGELLRGVSGTGSLIPGQTICFKAEPAQALPGCLNDTLPKVALTEVSTSLPCKAVFVPFPDDANPMHMHFNAQPYDPYNQTCSWDFGDGSTGTGAQTTHTYAQEGYYTVTLTVTGNNCSATKTHEVLVSEDNRANCGYEIAVTAVGMRLIGKISPADAAAGALTSINWYLGKSSANIAQSASFEFELSDYGSYNVCAEYDVKQLDGSICNAIVCQRLTIAAPGCQNPSMVDATALCPSFSTPVCGCDGVTYGNECEAISAGVTTWWAGTCGTPLPGTCSADLVATVVSGSPDTGVLVRFHNFSGGDFNNLQLDFGDGSPLHTVTSWNTVEHLYAQSGIYMANLTAWKNAGCVSSVTKIVATDVASAESENMPYGSEYVLPGDANGDKKANVYDLLNVGVGYFTEGSPRPVTSTAWEPQLAPNWDENTGTGVNYKHIDCDGNGSVNELDPTIITQYYTPIDSTENAPNPFAPEVYIDYGSLPDTIYINENNPVPLEITADLMVARPTKPIFNLYGLACALKYPDYIGHNLEINYDDNSDFGFSNHILWLPKNNYDRRQLDLGFVRKNGQGINGYFRMAKITFKAEFIIIVDVTYRSANNTMPFVVNIRGLKAIAPDGTEKEIATASQQKTIWIKLKKTTGTNNAALDSKIAVFPNPTSSEATLFTGDLKVENIEIVNSLGQVEGSIAASGERQTMLNVQDWAPGVYTLRVLTDKGMAEKKFVKI